MKNKLGKIIIISLCFLLLGSSLALARRSTDPMTTITDVRALGMGRAGLATIKGSNALFVNPAGLTSIKAIQGSTFSTKLMDEFNYFGLNGAMKLDFGWVGAGLGSMSVGEIPETIRYTQSGESRTYQISEYSAGSSVYSLAYANKYFLDELSIGVGFKYATDYINAGEDSQFESESLTGFGIDAGAQMPMEIFDRKIDIGLAMINLVPPSFKGEDEDESADEESSSYATNIRVGLSTDLELWKQDFILAADYDVLGIHLGGEWQGPAGLALRAGFDADNFAMGLGLKIFSITGFDNKPHAIAIDYAYRMYEAPLANTSFIGFSYLGVSQTERPVIMNPVSGRTITSSTINIEGTGGKGDEITIYVNEVPRKIVRADEDSGVWYADSVFLSEGRNEVKVQGEKLDFAPSEFSDPIMINADLTKAELSASIRKVGNEIFIKASSSKTLSKVATRLPNNQTLALVYDPETQLWVGSWEVPLSFMDKKLDLQTRGVDENGNKTNTDKKTTTVKMVNYPPDRTITSQDFLNVRGSVPAGVASIVIGDQVLTPEEDGSFQTTIDLPEIGKQLVEVQVVDEKGTTRTSTVRVLRKATAADVPQDSFSYTVINDLLTVGAMQADENNNFSPKESITRGALAQLIAKVKKLTLGAAPTGITDVPGNSPYAAAIAAVTEKGWMSATAGRFRPNGTLTRADAAGILVKMNDVKIPQGTPDEVFEDMPLSDPRADVIAAAAIAGLIPVDSENFYPDEPLNKETAALWFSNTLEVKDEVRDLMNWNTGYGLAPVGSTEEMSWESQLVVDFADAKFTTQEEQQGLKILSPVDQSTVYEKHAIVKGIVKEASAVTINGKSVGADKNGAFVAAVPLDLGGNVIIVEAPKERKLIRVFREAVFSDVSRGKEGQGMRILGTLGYLDTGAEFNPAQAISKKELAIVLARLKEDQPKGSSTKISDLPDDEPMSIWVKNAIDLGYFTLGAGGAFDPGGVVSRGLAIQAIDKFDGLKVPEANLAKPPFADVPISNAYAKDIAVALQSGLIPKTEKFFPEQPITRQELVDILMRTKVMQDKLKKLLDWDTFDQNNLKAPLLSKKKSKIGSRVIDVPSYARPGSTFAEEGAGAEDRKLLGFAPPLDGQLEKGSVYPRTADSVGIGAKPLNIISPRDLFVTSKTDVAVAGVVTIKENVIINGQTVAPNARGAFQKNIGLKPGKNIISIAAGANTDQRRVLRLLTFNDIAALPQKKVVEYLATLGYFSAGGSFQPSKAVAKDELVTLAVKMAALRTPRVSNATFSDVPADYSSAPAIYAAANAGIIEKKTSFQPQASIDRGQAISIIVKALKQNLPSGTLRAAPYPDVPVTNPYANAIAVAKTLGLIRQSGNFQPNAKLTRVELATWLVKTDPVKKQIIQLRDFSRTT